MLKGSYFFLNVYCIYTRGLFLPSSEAKTERRKGPRVRHNPLQDPSPALPIDINGVHKPLKRTIPGRVYPMIP